MRILRSVALTAAACLSACSSKDSGGDPPDLIPEVPATYHADIRPLLEANCTVCHVAGGIGPYALDTFDAAKTYGPIALAAVESGRMPPWMPSADCRHYENERILSEAQKSALRSWVKNGMLEGDPADYRPLTQTQPSSLVEAGPPSLTLEPGNSYIPKTERPDDYHCFPLAHEFDEETYLVMTNVEPEHPELVHHVIIYLVQPQYVPQLEQLDAQEEGEGYTCFGGPGTASPQNIGAWVPGSVPAMIAGDAAIRIAKGSRLVMQMHYNTLTAPPTADKTKLAMWFRDTQPAFLLNVQAFPHLGLELPAGEGNVHESRMFTNNTGSTWTAAAAAPHMHLLGTRIAMTAVRPAGEECIIDIPRWDFNWQQSYRFKDGTIDIAPGESVRLDCWYDNSSANQPIVNGTQLQPRKVNWGEGTLDEMCLGFLALVEPYAPLPEPGTVCTADFQTCYDGCIQSSLTPRTACALQCSQSVSSCAMCVPFGIGQCVVDDCPKVVGDMVECTDNCRSAPSPNECIRSQCLGNIIAFDTCAKPKIIAGDCDAFVSGCGVDLRAGVQ